MPTKSHELPRIQRPQIRALRRALPYNLGQTLPRRWRILNTPARVPGANQQPLHACLAYHGPPTSRHVRQIARLARRDFAVAELVADGADLVDDVLAAGLVDLHERGRGGQRDQRVAFAARVHFVVGAGVDLGRHGPRRAALALALGLWERDAGEESVGRHGPRGPDRDAVGAEGRDRRGRVNRLGPGPCGQDDGVCAQCVSLAVMRGVGDGLGGAGRVIYARGRTEDNFHAFLFCKRGHGRGELVRMHLRGGGWVAHFFVGSDAFCYDPIETFGYSCCSEQSNGFLCSFLQGDSFAFFLCGSILAGSASWSSSSCF